MNAVESQYRWSFKPKYLQQPKYKLCLKQHLIKIGIADGFVSKALGLLPLYSLSDNQALLINKCSSIHTYMMAFPIDVIYLDDNDQVVALDECVLPNKVSKPRISAQKVLELAPNMIKKLGIQLDLRLDFVSI